MGSCFLCSLLLFNRFDWTLSFWNTAMFSFVCDTNTRHCEIFPYNMDQSVHTFVMKKNRLFIQKYYVHVKFVTHTYSYIHTHTRTYTHTMILLVLVLIFSHHQRFSWPYVLLHCLYIICPCAMPSLWSSLIAKMSQFSFSFRARSNLFTPKLSFAEFVRAPSGSIYIDNVMTAVTDIEIYYTVEFLYS